MLLPTARPGNIAALEDREAIKCLTDPNSAGVVMRGGKSSDHIHFIDARFLVTLIKQYFEGG
jgi:hypothetical protein